ncbi:MAG: cytochrome c [Bdellovibrionales bacterium]
MNVRLLVLFVLSLSLDQVLAKPLCKLGEYHSEYTKKCEKSVLQIGLGDKIESLDLAQLKRRFSVQSLVVTRPPTDKDKKGSKERFIGIRLSDLLTSLLPKGQSLEDYVLSATCLDGFDPVMDQEILSKMKSVDALVAFRQVTSKGAKISPDGLWEMVQAPWGLTSPGPFYLVWARPDLVDWRGWPFQLKSMRLIRKRDYQEMLDKLKPAASELGYDQFRGKCIICHKVNGVGGDKARVDLLGLFKDQDPNSAFEYLSTVIRNPPDGMKDILDVKFKPAEIRALSDYLHHMATRYEK